MAYARTKYESDQGTIHPIRLNPNTVTPAGSAPTGDVTSSISAQISKSKREFGLSPRGIRIAQVVGTAPFQYSIYAFIPILRAANYNTGANVKGGLVLYKGENWIVTGLIPESLR